MHNLCVFCTFSTFAQKIFKGWGCNFTWSFGKVMRSKSMKMVFVARIIRHKLCMIYAYFDFLVQKSFLTKNYFLIDEIDLTTQGPLYTCLVQVFFYSISALRSFAEHWRGSRILHFSFLKMMKMCFWISYQCMFSESLEILYD